MACFYSAPLAWNPTGVETTHKQPKFRAWLDRHPRCTFHFAPTSCSWLNEVDDFFAKSTGAA